MSRAIKDLTGQRFGRLVAQRICGQTKSQNYIWECLCDCGETVQVRSGNLQSGQTKSCGCLSIIDMKGKRFGRLVVQKFFGINKENRACWICLCDCGNSATVVGKDLRLGHTKSCGCLQIECAIENGKDFLGFHREIVEAARKVNTTHGHTKNRKSSRTHSSYRAMITRCYRPSAHSYNHYGGRGIKVCARWLDSFENFLMDMGERPEGMTLDRIDVNGNYEPKNCKWSTPLEQTLNRRPCVTAENLPDEVIIKEFHRRFPEIDIDILAKRHSAFFAEIR